MTKDEELFVELLNYMDFGLYKDENGNFRLKDYQGAYLGSIGEDTFDDYVEVIDRLETYENDYFISVLEEEYDYDYNDWKDFYDYLSTLKDKIYEYDFLGLIVLSRDYDIDLNNCITD